MINVDSAKRLYDIFGGCHMNQWRANLPAAVAKTMVTNPLTIGF